MRFDDTLDTVLATVPSSPASAAAAWRQIVDLVGRGRVDGDGWAMLALAEIRSDVALSVRAASARALFGARPPAALVRMLALDDIAVGAPVLRDAELSDDEWIALLPELSPTARAVLRHRRDLPAKVARALESYGPVDFVLASGAIAVAPASAEVVAEVVPPPPITDPGPFVSVGSIALGLPVVAEALRRENDNEAPSLDPDGVFTIADVVARLEAFQREHDSAPVRAPRVGPIAGRFRFETDAAGTFRWVEGAARGAIVGLSLATLAAPGAPGVDGVAAGAYRRRSRFGDARLLIAGPAETAGAWLISAVPVFDPASGRFTGYRGSARRPRPHEQLERARPAADTLRQLVHELRTPTNAIAGFSEMIEHQILGPVAEPYRDQAAAMRGDAGGLLAAIDDLDAAARIESGALQLRPERIALAALIARIARELTELAAARCATLALPDGDAAVHADLPATERLLSRLIGTLLGAAGAGETIAVRLLDAAGARVGILVDRPAALAAYPGDAVLAIDSEDSPASLLGAGFALRLARNLARELGGSLVIGDRHLTLYLSAAVDRAMGQAQHN